MLTGSVQAERVLRPGGTLAFGSRSVRAADLDQQGPSFGSGYTDSSSLDFVICLFIRFQSVVYRPAVVIYVSLDHQHLSKFDLLRP